MASYPTRPADLLAALPFAGGLGIDLTEATAEHASGTLSWSSDLCTAGATLHGGVLMTLADTVGAVCAYLNLPPVARPLHIGRSLIVVQTDVFEVRERVLVGQTTQTQTVRTR